jgi:hypothetical protein
MHVKNVTGNHRNEKQMTNFRLGKKRRGRQKDGRVCALSSDKSSCH